MGPRENSTILLRKTMGPRENSTILLRKPYTSVLHREKKAVRVLNFSWLPPLINSPCSWVRIISLASLQTTPCDLYTTSTASSECSRSSMISGNIELMANSFVRNWTIQMRIQLSSYFGGSGPMFSSNKSFFYCTSGSVGKFRSPAGITSHAGGFVRASWILLWSLIW